MKINRTTFNYAIQAGMKRAGELLSPDEVGRLHVVARDATAFDTNYAEPGRSGTLNCGCPGSQANLADILDLGTSARNEFAYGFDDYLIKVIDAQFGRFAYARETRIEVAQ